VPAHLAPQVVRLDRPAPAGERRPYCRVEGDVGVLVPRKPVALVLALARADERARAPAGTGTLEPVPPWLPPEDRRRVGRELRDRRRALRLEGGLDV